MTCDIYGGGLTGPDCEDNGRNRPITNDPDLGKVGKDYRSPSPETNEPAWKLPAVLFTGAAIFALASFLGFNSEGNIIKRNHDRGYIPMGQRAYHPELVRALSPAENEFRVRCDGQTNPSQEDLQECLMQYRDPVIRAHDEELGQEDWLCVPCEEDGGHCTHIGASKK